MAQRFGTKEKIGALSHAAGIISMAASRLTIGGQQFITSGATSRTIATDVTMVANTRYQIFAVVVSGAVQLRISANENSVGPAGFTSWKLVGSFYSGTTSAFGSFVNIVGRPVTSEISYTTVINATTTPPAKGTTSTDSAKWMRDGQFLLMRYDFRQTGAGTAGNGTYIFPAPTNLTVDATSVQTSTGETGVVGTWKVSATGSPIGGTTAPGIMLLSQSFPNNVFATYIQNGGPAALQYETTNAFGSAGYPLSGPTVGFGFFVKLPIVGWTNTAIEDL